MPDLPFKRRPEDFIVKEKYTLSFKPKGEYVYFLLKKRNYNTLDALKLLAKELRVPLDQIGFAGLKDKLAITEQIISVPKRYVTAQNYRLSPQVYLRFLGYGNEPIKLGEFLGNEFTVTLRPLGRRQKLKIKKGLNFFTQYGFPNYFGEQRFGSVLGTKDFIARLLLKERYEEALKTYILSFLKSEERQLLNKLWGKWDLMLKYLPPNDINKRAVIKALKRQKPYEKVFKVIPKNIRIMFAFAYQSYLWNETLSLYIANHFKHFLIPIALWQFAVYRQIDKKRWKLLKNTSLPYAGAKKVPAPFKPYFEKVIKEERLDKNAFSAERVGIKLFLEGERPIIAMPAELKIVNEKKDSLTLHFFLPPNSYATVLLKALMGFDG
jgi:tRNA pseudouridine13 synthase